MENKKIVSSLAYKSIEQLLNKGLGLIISIVLARLLSPDHFGQLAILTVFINLSQTLIQSGFSSAVVQTKELHKSDYSTTFYISTLLAILMVVILFLCAPLISRAYETEALTAPLRVYSLTLLFGAFNSVQLAKLQREMRFKETMITRTIATVLSGAIGIYCAFAGFGLWALVIYNLSSNVLNCVTMLVACRWLPRLEFSIKRAKELWSFGWKMLVSSLLCSLYNDVRALIIGKKYSTEDLGYYNRGEQFPYVIANTIDTAVQSVMFPALASIQDQKERVKAILSKSVSLGALVIIPVLMGLAVVAEPFITLLLTEKWLPCVPYMQIICIGHASYSISSANLTAIKAIGRSDIYMKLETIRRIVMLAILLISVFCFNSIIAIVIGFAISSWIDVAIIMVPVKKLLGYGFIELVKDVWKVLLAVLIMYVAVYFIGLIKLSTIAVLCLQIIFGVIVYVLACFIIKEKSFFELLSFIKNKGKKNV